MVEMPGFMDDDGLNPEIDGWNCLQIFPRNGWPFSLPPNNQNPETELRIMANAPGNLGRDSVINPDPQFYDPSVSPEGSWFRQRDKNGKPVAVILDDQQLIAPRTRYDLYISRTRVIVLVNGQQRACNDFTGAPLTMAEGALGFGQILYHTTAEREELQVDYWVETGKRYILEDSPYLDVRTYDNVGFTEHVAPPAGFDDTVCFESTVGGGGGTDDGGSGTDDAGTAGTGSDDAGKKHKDAGQ
jgi:hypothetical protein